MRIVRDTSELEITITETAKEAARAAAGELVRAAQAGLHIALAGGTTPRKAYELAAWLEPDWQRAEVWWGDERCVPPDDERSNFRLARESLLDRLARLPHAVHRIRGELGAEAAAEAYEQELRGVTLGLVLLGIGADGHTASLFPESPALSEEQRLAIGVPAPDVERVTLTPRALRAASNVLFLATGEDKADAVRRALAEPPDAGIPASLISSAAGRTAAIVDRAAGAGLDFS